MNRFRVYLLVSLLCAACASRSHDDTSRLWRVYDSALKGAKYVDLTHTITPSIPVWAGFGESTFGPTVDPKTGIPYCWAKDECEATCYMLATDQLGLPNKPMNPTGLKRAT